VKYINVNTAIPTIAKINPIVYIYLLPIIFVK